MALSPAVGKATRWHPEATDWLARVTTAGGAASLSTVMAVSQFCRAVDTAGIRDRFLRINLAAGGFRGSLVPLYRSTSFGGTVVGNATDTNANLVSADYEETGALAGWKGNGTNKYLNTGVVPSTSLTLGNSHLSAMIATAPTSGSFPVLIGSQSASALFQLVSCHAAPSSGESYFVENLAAGGLGSGVVNPTGLFLGSAASASDRRCFLNGTQSGSTQTTSPASQLPNRPVFVFANNNNGTPANYNSGRISTYSIGLGMTAAQVAAYNTALAAFRAALGRA